jgi:hypothetical protein
MYPEGVRSLYVPRTVLPTAVSIFVFKGCSVVSGRLSGSSSDPIVCPTMGLTSVCVVRANVFRRGGKSASPKHYGPPQAEIFCGIIIERNT